MEKRISGLKDKKGHISSSSSEEGSPAFIIGSNNESSKDQSHSTVPEDNDDIPAGNETVTEHGSEFKARDNDIMKTSNQSIVESSDTRCKANKIMNGNDLTNSVSSAMYAIPSTSKDPAAERNRNNKKVLVRKCVDQPREAKDDKLLNKADTNANNDLAQGGMDVKSINIEHEIQICHPTGDKDQFRRGSILSSVINPFRTQFPYQCKRCSELFKSETQLSIHHNVCTGKKKHCCHKCEKSFLTEEGLSVHIDSHAYYESYKCKERANTVPDADSFAQYNHAHTDHSPHTDNTNGESVTGGDAESNHRQHNGHDKPLDLSIRGEMSSSDGPYRCEYCGSVWTTAELLSKHKSRNTGKKPSECTVCGKVLEAHCLAAQHQRLHERYKGGECLKCGKRFIRQGNLIRHTNTNSCKKRSTSE